MSKQEFTEIKEKLQDYQKEKYPMLSASLPEHNKAKNKENSYEKIKTDRRTNDKNELIQVLAGIVPQAKSTAEFINLVKQQGHEVYLRDGRLQGVKYEGERKFRFTNLGIDVKQFHELDIKRAKDEKELVELRSIRNKGRFHETEKEQPNENDDKIDYQQATQNELSVLRSDRNEAREQDEKELEIEDERVDEETENNDQENEI